MEKNFMNSMKDILDEDYNYAITENGAIGYATTNNELLDMNFKVASYRDDNSTLTDDFDAALRFDEMTTMKWLFFLRDIRGGLGERDSFRTIINHLGDKKPELIKKVVNLINEYGRYDDLFALFDTKAEDAVISVIRDQYHDDVKNMSLGKPISLLAKWLPSENASSESTKTLAKFIRAKLSLSSRDYRKSLSKLRDYLKVVERDMSARNWGEINYEAVPSKANILYSNAFLKHDEERRESYLASLKNGTTKINAGTLYPYDIVHKYTTGHWDMRTKEYDETLEQLWKALPDKVKGDETTLVVADGSGSMTTQVGRNSSVSALDVANSLAIYFAERARGEFKNKYITFSSKPQLVNLNGKSLKENLDIAFKHDECSDTNIEAVFNLILKTAVNNNMKQEDMPKNILIVSDMEFNTATIPYDEGDTYKKLFKVISEKYERAGYKLPKLVFWNVNSRTNVIPLKTNENGVILVSGFSQNVFDMVLSGEMDPYKALLSVLNTERYLPVEEALK